MNAAVMKKTQDTLGKVIKKPALTEKLLSKPPLRYLHDIFTEVIKTTGFMKGLYTEQELKAEHFKDKETKMAFLQKAIDVVMLVTGEPLAANPARIVAGLEPEKTNELLQTIAKCCLNKMSSREAVKRVLAGEKPDVKPVSTGSREKVNTESHEHQPPRALNPGEQGRGKDAKGRAREKGGGQQGEEDRERAQEREGEPDRMKPRRPKSPRERDRDKDKAKGVEKERTMPAKQPRRGEDKSRRKESGSGKAKVPASGEKSERKSKPRSVSPRDKENSETRDRHPDRENKVSKESQKKAKPEEPGKADQPLPVPKASKETQKKVKPEEPVRSEQPTSVLPPSPTDAPLRRPSSSSARSQRRSSRSENQGDPDGNGAPVASGDAQSPQQRVPPEPVEAPGAAVPTASTPSSRPRHGSARPPPPRIKTLESHHDGNPAERQHSVAVAPAAIIGDWKKLPEDEDEQFLVKEAEPLPSDMPEKEVAQELTSDEKHGGLVEKILETKKEYESTPPPGQKSAEQDLLSEENQRRDRDLVSREVERLRSSIQAVCRNSLPLGKIMDYLQEDVDAIQAELQAWRRENRELATALDAERRETERVLDPLRKELADLDQLIRDEQDRNCAVKANILRNEEKIQNMLAGIGFSQEREPRNKGRQE